MRFGANPLHWILIGICYIAAVTYLPGCSDAVTQYDRSSIKSQTKIPLVPGKDRDVVTPTGGLDSLENPQDKIRMNSFMPIIYDHGAGGITFNTTLEESKKILPKPVVGPIATMDGLTIYRSGLRIYWRMDEPQTPQRILITDAYSGSLHVDAPIGDIYIGRVMTEFFKDDALGDSLMIRLFNLLEGAPSDFDCQEKRICWNSEHSPRAAEQNAIVFTWGNRFAIALDKKTKQVVQIRMAKPLPQGKLAAPFDLATGTFSEEMSPPMLALGNTWQSIKDHLDVDAPTAVGFRSFGKNFSGIHLGFSKSHYEENYRDIAPEEKLIGVQLSDGYQDELLLGGKRIVIEAEDKFLSVGAIDPNARLAKNQIPLTLHPGVPFPLHQSFVEKLVDLLKETLEEKLPEGETFLHVNGFDSKEGDIPLQVNLIRLAPEGQNSYGIAFSFDRTQDSFRNISTSTWENSISLKIGQELLKTVPWNQQSLGGFKLGSTLNLEDANEFRSEATLDLSGRQTRVLLQKDSSIDIPSKEDPYKIKTQKVQHILVSEFGLVVGLKYDPEAAKESRDPYTVVAVASDSALGGISGICGDKDIKVFSEQKLQDLFKALSSAKCSQFVVQRDTEGLDQIRAIYFPNQFTRINIVNERVDTIEIYSPLE